MIQWQKFEKYGNKDTDLKVSVCDDIMEGRKFY
jgi:hypothetical protein